MIAGCSGARRSVRLRVGIRFGGMWSAVSSSYEMSISRRRPISIVPSWNPSTEYPGCCVRTWSGRLYFQTAESSFPVFFVQPGTGQRTGVFVHGVVCVDVKLSL